MKLTASMVGRAMACPGSVALEEGLSRELRYNPFKTAADRGKAIHAAAETLANAIASGKKCTVIQALKDHVQKDAPYYDDAKFMVNEYGKYLKKLIRERGKYGKCELVVEGKQRLDCLGVDNVFKADTMLITKVKGKNEIIIDIIDLKTGNFDYSESAYEQLSFSADVLSYSGFGGAGVTTFTGHVVQPGYWDELRRAVSMPLETSADDLPNRIKYIRANSDNYNVSEKCKFCPAVVVCPAMHAMYGGFKSCAGVGAEELSAERLEDIFVMSSYIKTFLDAVEQRIGVLIDSGTRFDSVYKKETSGHRKWISEKEVEKRLSFLGDKLYQPRKIKSPAQVERLAGKENISDLYDKPTLYKIAVGEKDTKELF